MLDWQRLNSCPQTSQVMDTWLFSFDARKAYEHSLEQVVSLPNLSLAGLALYSFEQTGHLRVTVFVRRMIPPQVTLHVLTLVLDAMNDTPQTSHVFCMKRSLRG
jgi:hypothetical protein